MNFRKRWLSSEPIHASTLAISLESTITNISSRNLFLNTISVKLANKSANSSCTPFNFYASKIEKRIHEGKEKFDGETVKNSFKEFMEKAEVSLAKLKSKQNRRLDNNDNNNSSEGDPVLNKSNRPILNAKKKKSIVKLDKAKNISNFKDRINRIN